jgi:hypothetical protein
VPKRQRILRRIFIFWDTIKTEKLKTSKKVPWMLRTIIYPNCSALGGPYERGAEPLDFASRTALTFDCPVTTQQGALASLLVLWWKWLRHLMGDKILSARNMKAKICGYTRCFVRVWNSVLFQAEIIWIRNDNRIVMLICSGCDII